MLIDPRQSERKDLEYVVAVRPEKVKQSTSANLINLGPNGLSFETSREFAPGEKLKIDIPPSNPVITLTARVVWCRRRSSSYAVGAEFVEISKTVRARLADMNAAISTYQETRNASGPKTSDAHQAAVE